MAEEVKTGVHEPVAMSSTVLVALIMAELDNTPQYFDSDKYYKFYHYTSAYYILGFLGCKY
jgi:hypothetical protein